MGTVSKPPSRRNAGKEKCNIRPFRELLALSIRDVAIPCGLSPAGVYRIENGGAVTLKTARKIAKFFGKPIDEIWPIGNAD